MTGYPETIPLCPEKSGFAETSLMRRVAVINW